MKTVRLVVLALIILFTSAASAFEIPWETETGFLRSGTYGWRYSYDIGFFNSTLMIDVDILLYGTDPGLPLRTRWESGIETIWSTDRFDVPILFNVDWVTTTTAADYDVRVIDGTGRWDMLDWYTIGAGGWGDAYQEEVAAHEFGHMIALWDEYAGGAIDPVTGLINTGGLMATLDGRTLDYYYAAFLSWYDERRPASLPEPSTILLIGSGALVLAFFRRRR